MTKQKVCQITDAYINEFLKERGNGEPFIKTKVFMRTSKITTCQFVENVFASLRYHSEKHFTEARYCHRAYEELQSAPLNVHITYPCNILFFFRQLDLCPVSLC